MSQNIKILFKADKTALAPQNLERAIWARLKQEQEKVVRRNLLIFGVADFISIVGLVAAGAYAVNLFMSSGFYNYLSLIWSDGGSLGNYWHDFALSLVEATPVMGVAVVLGVALVFLLSLSKTIINFKLFYYQLN